MANEKYITARKYLLKTNGLFVRPAFGFPPNFLNIFLRIFPKYFQIVPAGIVHLLIVSHKLISSFSKINKKKKKLYKLKRFEIPKHHEKCVLLLCRHLFFFPTSIEYNPANEKREKEMKKNIQSHKLYRDLCLHNPATRIQKCICRLDR